VYVGCCISIIICDKVPKSKVGNARGARVVAGLFFGGELGTFVVGVDSSKCDGLIGGSRVLATQPRSSSLTGDECIIGTWLAFVVVLFFVVK